jgi:hypothetical protein
MRFSRGIKMAKKNQGKKSTDTSVDKSVDKVANLWTDFSDQMEDKMRDLIETSAVEYRDIYTSWTELSDKMSKQMMNLAVGDEGIYKNLYNSWKEYSERLNTDLGKVTKSDDKNYNEFLEFWTKYSEEFSERLSNQLYDGIKEQYELYELWMDAFAKSAAEASKSGDIPSIINKYWLDALNQFYGFFSENKFIPGEIKEGAEPGEQLYRQYEEMYNYWAETSSKMLDEIMRSPAYGNLLAQSINSSMDSRQKIENFWVQNLRSLGIPTKNDLEEIREELKVMTLKLDEVDQAIKKNLKKK